MNDNEAYLVYHQPNLSGGLVPITLYAPTDMIDRKALQEYFTRILSRAYARPTTVEHFDKKY